MLFHYPFCHVYYFEGVYQLFWHPLFLLLTYLVTSLLIDFQFFLFPHASYGISSLPMMRIKGIENSHYILPLIVKQKPEGSSSIRLIISQTGK